MSSFLEGKKKKNHTPISTTKVSNRKFRTQQNKKQYGTIMKLVKDYIQTVYIYRKHSNFQSIKGERSKRNKWGCISTLQLWEKEDFQRWVAKRRE